MPRHTPRPRPARSLLFAGAAALSSLSGCAEAPLTSSPVDATPPTVDAAWPVNAVDAGCGYWNVNSFVPCTDGGSTTVPPPDLTQTAQPQLPDLSTGPVAPDFWFAIPDLKGCIQICYQSFQCCDPLPDLG